jgi:hypothetical protein
MKTPTEKAETLIGVTNGFFWTRPNFASLYPCLETIPYEQATAMVDKFYTANPEKWNIFLVRGILLALTIKGGPCPEDPAIFQPTK